MNWVSLALALLKFSNGLMAMAQRRGHINEGRRRQIADELASIAKSAKAAREARNAIDAMSDEDVIDALTE